MLSGFELYPRWAPLKYLRQGDFSHIEVLFNMFYYY